MLEFTCTNECIHATVQALNPNSSDHILSIAGSGDMPFAFLSRCARVTAVDINEDQLEFMRTQIENINSSRADYLMKEPPSKDEHHNLSAVFFTREQREDFFDERTMQDVRNNLRNLTIQRGNIGTTYGRFNKFYLSNAGVAYRTTFSNAPSGSIAFVAGTGCLTYEQEVTEFNLRYTGFVRVHEVEKAIQKICQERDYAQQPRIFRKE